MAEFLQDNLRVFVVPVDILNVPDLTTHEKMVYIVLRSFANPHKPEAFPSYETIAKLGSMTRRHAINCVKSLVEKGLLKKEMRFDVTKDRKIRNTSNLYKLQNPKVVNDIHHPSESDSPPLVNDIHQGSEYSSPEQNQLTKTIRTKSMNNNGRKATKESKVTKQSQETNAQENVVVDPILSFAKQNNIRLIKQTLQKWRKKADDATILLYLAHAVRIQAKNVCAWVTTAIDEQFDLSSVSEIVATTEKRKVRSEYIEKLKRAGAR
jgi:hypothetical protein